MSADDKHKSAGKLLNLLERDALSTTDLFAYLMSAIGCDRGLADRVFATPDPMLAVASPQRLAEVCDHLASYPETEFGWSILPARRAPFLERTQNLGEVGEIKRAAFQEDRPGVETLRPLLKPYDRAEDRRLAMRDPTAFLARDPRNPWSWTLLAVAMVRLFGAGALDVRALAARLPEARLLRAALDQYPRHDLGWSALPEKQGEARSKHERSPEVQSDLEGMLFRDVRGDVEGLRAEILALEWSTGA